MTCHGEDLRLDERIWLPLLRSEMTFQQRFLAMTARFLRHVENKKRQARRAIPRDKVTRNQGNTAGVRKRLKKEAGAARAAIVSE